jgi:hypothetical protein
MEVPTQRIWTMHGIPVDNISDLDCQTPLGLTA